MKIQRKSHINIFAFIGVFTIHVCFTYFTSSRKIGRILPVTDNRFMIVKLVPIAKSNKIVHQEITNKKILVEKKMLPFKEIKNLTPPNNNDSGTLEIAVLQKQPIPEEFNDKTLILPTETILEQAKRNIAKIDKEVRGKTPAVPTEKPETRFSRLAQGFEQAYVGSNSNDTRSYYESPEGIFYFMETVRGQKKCSMSGASGSPSGLSRGAAPIKCPISESWKKY
ncbi:hypothetical protein D3C81_244030 [compost metagenome]